MNAWTLFVAALIAAFPLISGQYRPLVLIHGVNSDYLDLSDIENWAKEDYPSLLTVSLDAFNDDYSIVTLLEQVPKFNLLLKNITDQYGEVNLLGYSQGGSIARAVVETSNNPNIKNFISLSAPAVGQYGIPFLNATGFLDQVLSEDVYKVCYNTFGQLISVCNYWKDPNQIALYLSVNKYLPYLNNEIQHNDSQQYKENFAHLSKLVLIGGPDDGVIWPWQSAQYGYWDSDFNVIPYQQQDYYTGDWFGLKTLDEQDKITLCTMPGVHHTKWPHTKSVYEECIKPYLT